MRLREKGAEKRLWKIPNTYLLYTGICLLYIRYMGIALGVTIARDALLIKLWIRLSVSERLYFKHLEACPLHLKSDLFAGKCHSVSFAGILLVMRSRI